MPGTSSSRVAFGMPSSSMRWSVIAPLRPAAVIAGPASRSTSLQPDAGTVAERAVETLNGSGATSGKPSPAASYGFVELPGVRRQHDQGDGLAGHRLPAPDGRPSSRTRAGRTARPGSARAGTTVAGGPVRCADLDARQAVGQQLLRHLHLRVEGAGSGATA